MKKKMFLTGSGGFIGKNIKEKLSDIFDITAPRSSELNLLDEDTVAIYLKHERFDVVVHTAAIAVGRNHNQSNNTNKVNNELMFKNIAQCSSSFGRMFHMGSGAEFGKQDPIISVKEEDIGIREPSDDYGKMKLQIQQSLSKYNNVYNLRLFGIFGSYEDWEIRFISNAICRALFDMDIIININVYFDYLYVEDFLSILTKLISIESIPYKDINVCTGEKIDLVSIARIIKQVSDKNIKVKVKHEGFQNEYTGNNERLQEVLGPLSFTPLEKSIQKLFDWYHEHKQDIDPNRLSFDV